jgi:alkylation response protein AidB-like acyl-CoA dehydrogenase
MNHDIAITEMIDESDEARIGLLGRDAEIQFVRLAADYGDVKRELAAMKATAEKAEADLTRAIENMDGASAKTLDRLTQAEAKLKVADAMLSEIWGAYNRIGDALKMPEKQAVERGEV